MKFEDRLYHSTPFGEERLIQGRRCKLYKVLGRPSEPKDHLVLRKLFTSILKQPSMKNTYKNWIRLTQYILNQHTNNARA